LRAAFCNPCSGRFGQSPACFRPRYDARQFGSPAPVAGRKIGKPLSGLSSQPAKPPDQGGLAGWFGARHERVGSAPGAGDRLQRASASPLSQGNSP